MYDLYLIGMDIFNSKKLIRSKSGLRIVSTNDAFKSPFVIQEPNWVADSEVVNCSYCSAKFNFTTRKHHCRRCGNIFCNYCCKTKIELHRMCFVDPVRICVNCEPQTRTENIFFDKHLKMLLNGAVFKYENKGCESGFQLLHCKLSPDHRYLLFEGVAIPPIDINLIKTLEVKDEPSSGLKSLLIEYVIGEATKTISLGCAVGPQVEKTGTGWLIAIQQAYKMLGHQEQESSLST